MKNIARLLKTVFHKKNTKHKLVSFWTANENDSIKAILICHRGKHVIAKKIDIQSAGDICGELRGQPIYDSIVYNQNTYNFDGAQPSKKLKDCIGMLHLKSLEDNTIVIDPGLRYTQTQN